MNINDYRRKIEQSVAKAEAAASKSARTRAAAPQGIVANKKAPPKTRVEALGRATREEGPDAVPDTALERLADPKESPAVRLAAIKLLQVPYKGAAPGLADLMVGSVDVAIMSVPSVLPLVRGGKLTPVAVTTSKRSPMLPETPTLDEAGVKGIDAGIWLGLFAPAGTPPAIVARLNAEVNKVLQMPDVREKIATGGAQAAGGTSEDFAAFVRADYAKWGKIVKDANIKLE